MASGMSFVVNCIYFLQWIEKQTLVAPFEILRRQKVQQINCLAKTKFDFLSASHRKRAPEGMVDRNSAEVVSRCKRPRTGVERDDEVREAHGGMKRRRRADKRECAPPRITYV